MEYNYLPAELPTRAWEAYEEYKGKREVSLLLSVAWAVFVVPTERLDFLEKPNEHHAQDSVANIGMADKLVAIWKKKRDDIVDGLQDKDGIYTVADRSTLPRAGSNDWFAKVLEAGKACAQPKYSDLLPVLRHGLSHGNVWTDNEQEAIQNIYIANYPPNASHPIQVLRIQSCAFYSLISDFIDWYRTSIFNNLEKKNQLASLAIRSGKNNIPI